MTQTNMQCYCPFKVRNIFSVAKWNNNFKSFQQIFPLIPNFPTLFGPVQSLRTPFPAAVDAAGGPINSAVRDGDAHHAGCPYIGAIALRSMNEGGPPLRHASKQQRTVAAATGGAGR